MSTSKIRVCILFIAGLVLQSIDSDGQSQPSWTEENIHFATEVFPVLKSRCMPCHGDNPEKIKGGLLLDNFANFAKGGDSITDLLKTGKDNIPIFIKIISREVEDLEMPPKESDKLSREEIGHFRKWIENNTPWPDSSEILKIQNSYSKGVAIRTSGGLSKEWDNRRYEEEKLWPYRPLQKPGIPADFIGNPIDYFIEKAAKQAGVEVAAIAEPSELIRRISYNLHGLPPQKHLLSKYSDRKVIEKNDWDEVVNELLNSPHYGEKFANHWLDVVKYADSAGMANDFFRGSAWRYRDFVIRSFNKDKPWDQFVTQQIAGDEMDSDDPENLLGLGFLRMGPWELTGMEVAKIARQKFLDDVTDLVGQAFLSQPLQCAKCHDHKFDPIPTRDYYAIQAVFINTQLAETKLSYSPDEVITSNGDVGSIQRRKNLMTSELNRLNKLIRESQFQWCKERGLPPMTRSAAMKKGLPENQIPPRHAGFTVEDFGMERISRKAIQRLQWEDDMFQPIAHVVYSGAWQNAKNYQAPKEIPKNRWEGEFEKSFILDGGDPFSPTTSVDPGRLSVLDFIDCAEVPSQSRFGKRLNFAKWLTSEKNALALRSIINRVWTWNFGNGLIETPNHFGTTTAPSKIPGLLDFLCHHFIENSGSIKSLNRLILTSQAWQRSSFLSHAKDKDAHQKSREYFSSFSPRRLTAEEIRDSHLFVSGQINLESGGPPTRPIIDLETALQPRMVMGTFAEAWQPSLNKKDRNKRSIYTLKLRGLRDPFRETFDTPNPDLSCAMREESVTPNQVFSLMNNEVIMTQSSYLAKKIFNESKLKNLSNKDLREIEKVINKLYLQCLGRGVSNEEKKSSLEYFLSMVRYHSKKSISKPIYPNVVTRNAVEENTGQPFSFEEKLFGYDEMEKDIHLSDLPIHQRALAEVAFVLMNSNEFMYVF